MEKWTSREWLDTEKLGRISSDIASGDIYVGVTRTHVGMLPRSLSGCQPLQGCAFVRRLDFDLA